MTTSNAYSSQELRLLQLLSRRYTSTTSAHIEMINLNAILALPKGTDHYISDIHGAYDQFDHILRHASGAIRRKIQQTFEGELNDFQQTELAMLIYYPELKLRQLQHSGFHIDTEWQVATIGNLVRVARTAAQKYTRSKVRKRLPSDLAYILEELLTERPSDFDQKEHYYESIVRSIVALGEGETSITTLAELIQRLVVDRVYILGDIFDRGPAAERVIERLMTVPYVSIQWGNHDVSWMGAASGCEALVANVVRLALRYATIGTLTDGYGISLWSLAHLADEIYANDPCEAFQPSATHAVEGFSRETLARMHKAITIIQFKLDQQIIRRHPEYAMNDRLLLNAIDLRASTVMLRGTAYPLRDNNWPTLDESHPDILTEAETAVINELRKQFQQSARLQRHIRFLYSYGNMFQVQDGNLKFHGCLPVDEQGRFVSFPLDGEHLAGPELLQRYERLAREAFFSHDPASRQQGQDSMWYLWCGPLSPLFGRERMTTFERYFLADEHTHEEPKGPYYALRDNVDFCRSVLAAFGGDIEHGHIINGHTPVKVKRGERPLLADGKLIIIDGGMSEAYQRVTGIAGYTLIGNSHELILAAHEGFTSAEEMVRTDNDLTPTTTLVDQYPQRVLIADTDTGTLLRGQLEDLQKLVNAYRNGILVEDAPPTRVIR